jgi:methyltransferase of FxLD system
MEVYAPFSAVITKRDDDGNAVSSVPAPQVQAAMLEDTGIKPGMRVAEFGSGGANAAMLAELVGTDGLVVTTDVDPEITDRAARFLPQAGYPQVKVVTIDAENGLADLGSFDVVVVTFGAWDVPPAWRDQLVEGDRLVVPPRLFGLGRTITFVKEGNTLISDAVRHFGFVPAQGTGAHRGMCLELGGGQITFGLDNEFPVNTEALGQALTTARAEVWSSATNGRRGPLATVQMRLATALRGFCWISITDEVDPEVIDLRDKKAVVAAIETDGSFAYVLTRSTDEDFAASGSSGAVPRPPVAEPVSRRSSPLLIGPATPARTPRPPRTDRSDRPTQSPIITGEQRCPSFRNTTGRTPAAGRRSDSVARTVDALVTTGCNNGRGYRARGAPAWPPSDAGPSGRASAVLSRPSDFVQGPTRALGEHELVGVLTTEGTGRGSSLARAWTWGQTSCIRCRDRPPLMSPPIFAHSTRVRDVGGWPVSCVALVTGIPGITGSVAVG